MEKVIGTGFAMLLILIVIIGTPLIEDITTGLAGTSNAVASAALLRATPFFFAIFMLVAAAFILFSSFRESR